MKNKKDQGLNGGSLQGSGGVVRSSAVPAGIEIRLLSIPDAALRALKKQARYLTYTSPKTIYHYVDADYRYVFVGVFGDGANGAYEWFIWDENTATLKTSDCGYGCTGVALCSGLVEAGTSRANGDHDLILVWNPSTRTSGPDPASRPNSTTKEPA
jgi:hypothetical protein